MQPALKPNFSTNMRVDSEWHMKLDQNLPLTPVDDAAPDAYFNHGLFSSHVAELPEMINESSSPDNFDTISCVDEIIDHSDEHARSSPVLSADGADINIDKYTHEQEKEDVSDDFDYDRILALRSSDALGRDGQRVNVTDSELPPVQNANQQLRPSKAMQPHKQSSHTIVKLAKVSSQLCAFVFIPCCCP